MANHHNNIILENQRILPKNEFSFTPNHSLYKNTLNNKA